METRIGDIKLIHHKNNPVVYARVEEILADTKPGWWQVRLLILQVPARRVTWILRDAYIDGAEFTMDGEPMVLEALAPPRPSLKTATPEDIDLAENFGAGASAPTEEPPQEADSDKGGDDDDGGAKVVDLSSRRRKK